MWFLKKSERSLHERLYKKFRFNFNKIHFPNFEKITCEVVTKITTVFVKKTSAKITEFEKGIYLENRDACKICVKILQLLRCHDFFSKLRNIRDILHFPTTLLRESLKKL